MNPRARAAVEPASEIQDEKKPLERVVFCIGAGNETRTRDPDLGKVVLYQLSYSRIV